MEKDADEWLIWHFLQSLWLSVKTESEKSKKFKHLGFIIFVGAGQLSLLPDQYNFISSPGQLLFLVFTQVDFLKFHFLFHIQISSGSRSLLNFEWSTIDFDWRSFLDIGNKMFFYVLTHKQGEKLFLFMPFCPFRLVNSNYLDE